MMKRINPLQRLAGAIIACLCLLIMPVSAQDDVEPVNLRADLKVGTETRYEYWSRRQSQIRIEAAGQQRDAATTIESKGRMTLKIDQVKPDGSIVATMTYDQISLDVTGPDGVTKTNSTEQGSGEIEPLHNLITAIVDHPFTVELNPSGEAVSITGLDGPKGKLQNPDMMPEERDFMETARTMLAIVNAPTEATPGTTWQEQFDANHQMGTMKYDTTWTLDRVGAMEGIEVASLSGVSQLDLEVDRSEMPPNAPPVDIQMPTYESKSQALFDLDAHQLIMMDSKTSHTITVNVSMGGQSLSQTITEIDHQQMWRDDVVLPESP